MGDPLNEETELGPLTSLYAVRRARAQVTRSVEVGARCLAGGETLPPAYYMPTILEDVTPDMPVMAKEAFGPPVTPVYLFRDADSAVEDRERFALRTPVRPDLREPAQRASRGSQAGCGGVVINHVLSHR